MKKFRVLDLFSGIGGFSLGLERAGGFETVAFCEIEPYCRAVLKKHWPHVKQYDDVRALTADTLARDGIAVDVICGGFPCQDLSFAGKRVGLEGARSGLWREYARLIGELQPRFVIVENVPGLLNLGMGAVLGDLSTLGYDATWDCVPAAAVGAPHRRDRVWIIAHANGQRVRQQQVRELGSGRAAVAKSDCKAVADAYGGNEHGRRGAVQVERKRSSREVAQDGHAGGTQWSFEPDVGGSPDGFPAWLHRCVGGGLSHAESCRRCEVLRDVWNRDVAQALWRAAGGLERISQAEVLFSFVREYERGTDEARLLVAGQKASEGFLRGLRQRAITRSAPRRSGQQQQRPEQYPDVVQSMPRLLARDSQADWQAYSWEDAVPRVAVGVPSRVDRLRSLGNAVVPQIPELIGKAIMQAEGMTA